MKFLYNLLKVKYLTILIYHGISQTLHLNATIAETNEPV